MSDSANQALPELPPLPPTQTPDPTLIQPIQSTPVPTPTETTQTVTVQTPGQTTTVEQTTAPAAVQPASLYESPLNPNPVPPALPPEPPQTNDAVISNTIENDPEEKKKNLPLIIAIIVVLILIAVAIGILFFLNNRQTTSNNNNNNNTTPPPTVVPSFPVSFTNSGVNPLTDKKLFYVKDNNIYSIDIGSKTTVQFTTFLTGTGGGNIGQIEVIDETTLGFSRCVIVTNDFGCTLNTLNLTDKKITEKEKLDPKSMIIQFGFFSTSKYAYEITTDTKWQVISVNNAVKTTLVDVAMAAYGRGGFKEDSNKISYSPDGNNLLHISTGNPRATTDFNTYVFNLVANTNQKITESTQPEWLDNVTIIYRRYAGGAGDGLYTFNINTAAKSKITVLANTSYEPEIQDGKVLYFEDAGDDVWLYNVNTGTYAELVSSASDAFWVTTTDVAYYTTTPCTPTNCEGMNTDDFESTGMEIYNTTTKTKTTLDPMFKSLSIFATLYK